MPLILRRHYTFQHPKAPSARHFTGGQTPHGRKLCCKISYHPSPSHCTLGPLPAPRAFALHLKNAGTPVSGCSKELPEEAVFFRAQPESLLSIVLQAANVVLLLLGPDLLLLCAVDAFIHLELIQGSLTELCTGWPRYAQCNTPPMHWERCVVFFCTATGRLGELGWQHNLPLQMLCSGSCRVLEDYRVGGRGVSLLPITARGRRFLFALLWTQCACAERFSPSAGVQWVIPLCC